MPLTYIQVLGLLVSLMSIWDIAGCLGGSSLGVEIVLVQAAASKDVAGNSVRELLRAHTDWRARTESILKSLLSTRNAEGKVEFRSGSVTVFANERGRGAGEVARDFLHGPRTSHFIASLD